MLPALFEGSARNFPAEAMNRKLRVKAGLPRWVDLLASLVGLFFVAPLIALSALAIKVTSSGPAFFRQVRVGRGGRTFTLIKLRTMQVANTGPQVTAGDDRRITPVGRLLRKAKLDELPGLWNVVRGDMSLVGPRPEVQRYVDLEDPRWRFVVEARPGITDPVTLLLRNEEELLSEVAGDRELFYTEVLQPYKLNGYVEYLENRNSVCDLKVLLKTALAIIFSDKAPPPTVKEIVSSVESSKLALAFEEFGE